MCNCVNEINEKLIEAGTNTKIKVPLILGSGMELGAAKLQVVTEKADSSKRKKAVPVFTSFCPFCGEKHKSEG